MDDCIEVCEKALKLADNFGPAWNNLALCYTEKEDYKKAIECVDKAIETGFDVSDEFLKELEKHR